MIICTRTFSLKFAIEYVSLKILFFNWDVLCFSLFKYALSIRFDCEHSEKTTKQIKYTKQDFTIK